MHLVIAYLAVVLRALARKLVRLLEIGLIINLRNFPAFRVAFEPGSLNWDVDPAPFIQRASDAIQGNGRNGTHESQLANRNLFKGVVMVSFECSPRGIRLLVAKPGPGRRELTRNQE